jgi:16S rRNA (adenine1518-N6/adenine1519-N6)-dimethyltransferase
MARRPVRSPPRAAPRRSLGAKPLGRRETRDLLSRHGLAPKTSLGQHFLVDPNTIDKIVRLSEVRPGDRVLEVGPGLGTLTAALVAAGTHVIAVEQDRALAPALEEVLAGSGRVRIIWADALSVDYGALLRGRRTALVANLPYQIATPLVMRLLEERPEVEAITVMVQKEVGQRLVAEPGSASYGAVSAKIAYLARAELLAKVSRRVFLPEPAVDSVVVGLRRRARPPVAGLRERIFAVIEAGFAQRRKTIRSALRNAGVDPGRLEAALAAAGVDPETRAERLGLEEFGAISSLVRVARR